MVWHQRLIAEAEGPTLILDTACRSLFPKEATSWHTDNYCDTGGLVRALWVETHESWLEDNRYLNMELLQEQKKAWLRQAA